MIGLLIACSAISFVGSGLMYQTLYFDSINKMPLQFRDPYTSRGYLHVFMMHDAARSVRRRYLLSLVVIEASFIGAGTAGIAAHRYDVGIPALIVAAITTLSLLADCRRIGWKI